MANNSSYGPPPPMMNSQPTGYYYPPAAQQQQHQSERISGDGEEVYGRYYNNFIRQPGPPQHQHPQGQGHGPPPPMGMLPPMPPPQQSSVTPQTVQLGSGQGTGYGGYDPTQQPNPIINPTQPQTFPQPGPLSQSGPPIAVPQPPIVYDQYDYGSNSLHQPQSLPPQSQGQQQQSFEHVQTNYDPGTIVPQQPLPPQDNRSADGEEQQQHSFGQVQANFEAGVGPTAPPPFLSQDDRSVDGEEQGQQQQRHSFVQDVDTSGAVPLMPDNRSVDGEEQQQQQNFGQVVQTNYDVTPSLPPSQDNRSVDGEEQQQHQPQSFGQVQPNYDLGPTALPTDNRRVDDDDEDDYDRRQPRGRKERDRDSEDYNRSHRARGGGRPNRELDSNNGRTSVPPPSHDNRSVDGDDDDDYNYDRRQPRGRRERERDRDRDYEEHNRSSQRVRGGGGTDRDRSRREWETSRDSYSRPYRRDYDDFEDEYERPRSRSSYHDDEFYTSNSMRRRRRGDSDKPRGPPSEYSLPPRGYPSRDTRPSYGYMGYPQSQYALPEPAPVTSQAQSFQMYLATFRTKNPAQYREWYHKYMAHMSDPARIPFPPVPGYAGMVGRSAQGVGSVAERSRPPSQSGGNLAFDDSAVLGVGLDDSKFRPIKESRDPTPPSRNTPLIFSTPHAIAKISPLGYIVRNRYGNPNVDLVSIKSLMKRLPEYKEMKSFPGPLIKDITHKNTIVQFCQRKIRDLEVNDNQLDRENLILLWELLILLLRQNGSAIGSDIAELLLKSKSAGQSLDSAGSGQDSSGEDEDQVVKNTRKGKAVNHVQNCRSTTTDDDKHCVDVFCQKLVYGHKREALEYAMDNALWGHALFFASKMDEKLYGTVLARFANETMSLNSPLQTLYHVLSGKQPPSVTCCGDESFGDWKPHLAMLLSNMGQRPEFEANTMRTLGRTLAIRKLKFAAQFCYLMAESEFAEDSDIGSLLGFNPAIRNILEATQMTEIYEFARSLANPEFSLGSSFIESKLNYTKELINIGFTQEAYSYCEEMTKSLRKHRVHAKEQALAKDIFYIAERLVNCDVGRGSGEPAWMDDLRKMADQLESETTSRKLSLATSTSDNIDDSSSNIHMNHLYINDNPNSAQLLQTDGGSAHEGQSVPAYPTNDVTSLTTPYDNMNSNQWHQQPPIQGYPSLTPYDPMNNQMTPEINTFQQPTPNFQLGNHLTQDNNNYWPPNDQSKLRLQGDHNFGANAALLKKKVVRFEDEELNGDEKDTVQSLKARQLDNLTSKTNPPQNSYNADGNRPHAKPQAKSEKKSNNDDLSRNQQKKKSSWISGIFGSIIKQKNQMILPDDKEPTIVWDEATNSWKNTKGDEDDDSGPKGPPPKDSDLMGMGGPSPPSFQNTGMPMSHPNPQPSNNGLNQPQFPQTQQQQTMKMNGGPVNSGIANAQLQQPSAPGSGPNKFQRPKGLKPRNNYVDVFNSNPSAQQKPESPTVPLPSSTTAPSSGGMPNIFMPPPVPVDTGPTSFLSESGNYGGEQESSEAQASAPPMFNPAQFQNQNIPNYGINR